jgi:hypothetical protein
VDFWKRLCQQNEPPLLNQSNANWRKIGPIIINNEIMKIKDWFIEQDGGKDLFFHYTAITGEGFKNVQII